MALYMWRNYKNLRGATYNPWTRFLKLIVFGILILLVAYMFFFKIENKVSTENFNDLKDRFDQLENRLNQIEYKLNSFEKNLTKTDSMITAKPSKDRYHVVRRGDTLSKIAQEYGLTVTELCRLNKISPETVIHRGQKILIAPENLQQ